MHLDFARAGLRLVFRAGFDRRGQFFNINALHIVFCDANAEDHNRLIFCFVQVGLKPFISVSVIVPLFEVALSIGLT